MKNLKFKLPFQITHRVRIAGTVATISLVALGFYGHNQYTAHRSGSQRAQQNNPQIIDNKNTQSATLSQKNSNSSASQPTQPPVAPDAKPTTATKPVSKPVLPAAAPTPPPTPPPSPTPEPPVNTTNCLPPNPNQYATYYISKTNSQYLQTNSYVNTTKIYAAFQFAGLLNTINFTQYVVLAMDDSQWGSFTQAQLDWMNASPANMRSVIGWQIITSCITYDGVNPVKNIPAGTKQTVSTINGPVTFTAGGSGNGTFGSANVAIWDWFTSNGAVTVAGFVNTSQVP